MNAFRSIVYPGADSRPKPLVAQPKQRSRTPRGGKPKSDDEGPSNYSLGSSVVAPSLEHRNQSNSK
jgi:hypothetical protein